MYVQGFVLAVPTANRQAYLEHARQALPMFKEYGTDRMVEAWGDDVPDGGMPFDGKRMVYGGFETLLDG